MTTRRDSFPFLNLPLELRVEVIRHIDDVQTLRDLLSIPQIIQTVAPFLRLVTNAEKLSCFQDIEKYVEQVPLESLSVLRNGDELIVLIEIHNGTPLVQLVPLKRCTTFTYISMDCKPSPSHMEVDIDDIFKLITTELHCQATHLVVNSPSRLSIGDENDHCPLPKNLTLENCGELWVTNPHREDYRTVRSRPIRYIGLLSSLMLYEFSDDGYPTEQLRDTLHQFRDVIAHCGSTEITLTGHYPTDADKQPEALTVDGLTFNKAVGKLKLDECSAVSNIFINSTSATNKPARYDPDNCVYLNIDLKAPPDTKSGARFVPLLENIVGPDVQKMKITCCQSFPKFKNIWLPNLHELFIRGNFTTGGVENFGNVGTIEDAHELSRMISVVKRLHVDQMTISILGYLLPNTLQHLEYLSITEVVINGGDDIPIPLRPGRMKRLRPRYGKIQLPSVREIKWVSNQSDVDTILDISQLSKLFEYPKLQTFNYTTKNKHVFLWELAPLIKKVKELTIGEAPDFGYNGQGGPFDRSRPLTHLQSDVWKFPKLKSLTITHGHNAEMFTRVSLPRLKRLDITVDLGELRYSNNFRIPGAPVLEYITMTTIGASTERLDRKNTFTISGFPKLKSLIIQSRALPGICISSCPLLEHFKYDGYPLSKLKLYRHETTKLKSMSYVTDEGMPCHDLFSLMPGVRVEVKACPYVCRRIEWAE